jgi:hypothetical protein
MHQQQARRKPRIPGDRPGSPARQGLGGSRPHGMAVANLLVCHRVQSAHRINGLGEGARMIRRAATLE